jgi:extradiol dioxygenase family protein
MQSSIFHLAINVTDLCQAREFYGKLLGAEEGRSTETWVDFNFFGHQLSLHLGSPLTTELTGKVDNTMVPMPHFGLVLSFSVWKRIANRLDDAGIEFVIPPSVRFAGKPSEQHTFFFFDPFGNPLELKSFKDMSRLFTS